MVCPGSRHAPVPSTWEPHDSSPQAPVLPEMGCLRSICTRDQGEGLELIPGGMWAVTSLLRFLKSAHGFLTKLG